MKGALVCVGHLRNYRQTIDSLLENLVAPNELDVFLFLQRNSSCKVRLNRPGNAAFAIQDPHDEEAYLKERFGPRLVDLQWIDDHPKFDAYLQEINAEQTQRRERLSEIFPDIPGIRESVWQVDWWCRLAYAAQLFESQLANYDWAFRFRIDCAMVEPFNLREMKLSNNMEMRLVRDFSHSAKEIFLCHPTLFCAIVDGFARAYGIFIPGPSRPFRDFMAPEAQFAQFLRYSKVQAVDIGLQYGYKEDPQTNTRVVYCTGNGMTEKIVLTGFPSDISLSTAMDALKMDKDLHFHPVIGQDVHDQIVANAAAAAAATIVSPTPPTPDATPPYEILFYVFLALFIVSNWFWVVVFRKKSPTPSGSISAHRRPSQV